MPTVYPYIRDDYALEAIVEKQKILISETFHDKFSDYVWAGWYADRGRLPLADRPWGSSMIERLKRHDVVLAATIPSVFIGSKEALRHLDNWSLHQIGFYACAEGFDLTEMNPDRAKILKAARTFSNMPRSSARPGQGVPLGFKKHGRQSLVPNVEELYLMRTIYNMVRDIDTCAMTARFLQRWNICLRGRPFDTGRVERVVMDYEDILDIDKALKEKRVNLPKIYRDLISVHRRVVTRKARPLLRKEAARRRRERRPKPARS